MQYDNRTAGERLWYDESFYDVADFEVDEEFDEEADLLRWFDRGEKLYDYLDGRISKRRGQHLSYSLTVCTGAGAPTQCS